MAIVNAVTASRLRCESIRPGARAGHVRQSGVQCKARFAGVGRTASIWRIEGRREVVQGYAVASQNLVAVPASDEAAHADACRACVPCRHAEATIDATADEQQIGADAARMRRACRAKRPHPGAHAPGVAYPAWRAVARAAGMGMDQRPHGVVLSLRERTRYIAPSSAPPMHRRTTLPPSSDSPCCGNQATKAASVQAAARPSSMGIR